MTSFRGGRDIRGGGDGGSARGRRRPQRRAASVAAAASDSASEVKVVTWRRPRGTPCRMDSKTRQLVGKSGLHAEVNDILHRREKALATPLPDSPSPVASAVALQAGRCTGDTAAGAVTRARRRLAARTCMMNSRDRESGGWSAKERRCTQKKKLSRSCCYPPIILALTVADRIQRGGCDP
jgi:hypothetical protein